MEASLRSLFSAASLPPAAVKFRFGPVNGFFTRREKHNLGGKKKNKPKKNIEFKEVFGVV